MFNVSSIYSCLLFISATVSLYFHPFYPRLLELVSFVFPFKEMSFGIDIVHSRYLFCCCCLFD